MARTVLTAWQRLMGLLKLDKRDVLQTFYYAIFAGLVNLSLPLGIQAIINLIQGAEISTSWIILIILVTGYDSLLAAEERKFSFGESSLFLINLCESKLIDAELKQIEVQNKFYTTKAKLFNGLAINPENS